MDGNYAYHMSVHCTVIMANQQENPHSHTHILSLGKRTNKQANHRCQNHFSTQINFGMLVCVHNAE